MIKLGILFGPTQFDGLRLQIACLTSDSEIKKTFKILVGKNENYL
jgi:hypothetical protein